MAYFAGIQLVFNFDGEDVSLARDKLDEISTLAFFQFAAFVEVPFHVYRPSAANRIDRYKAISRRFLP